MDKIIETRNLKFDYKTLDGDKEPVLLGVDIEINRGDFVAILGHNGSGKSTLAKHFNSVLIPSSGVVYVEGIDTKDDSMLFEIRQNVGMVFQNPDNQIVATIVEEDIAFAPENLGVEQSEIEQRVEYALSVVNMQEYRKHAAHQLSGGQKQRVAIAGIIAMKPSCIVLDEPTAMLDPIGRKEVLEAVRKLNKEEKITVVLITHYMNEATDADRVVVMDQGLIVLDDSPRKVFAQVEKLEALGLEAPQVTSLLNELKTAGIDVDTDAIDVDEAAQKILMLFSSRGKK